MKSKIWTLDEARKLLPEIIEITSSAYKETQRIIEDLESKIHPENIQELKESELQAVISEWALGIAKMHADVKGLWLVDFDNGRGYYCWKLGESDILYEHTYEAGYAGRKPIKEEI
ncbi:MAG: DUF2203 domain-containing protein [Spirochaetia bacterium]|nr:DUF2203 domain-containing protein [Spirochaetia bacterium]